MVPRSGSNRVGSFHSRRKTSWTISSARAGSMQQAASEPEHGAGVAPVRLGQGPLVVSGDGERQDARRRLLEPCPAHRPFVAVRRSLADADSACDIGQRRRAPSRTGVDERSPMRRSCSRTSSGATTSITSPQPASCSASIAGRRLRRSRPSTRPSSSSPSTVSVEAELAAAARSHGARRRADDGPGRGADSTRSCRRPTATSSARSKSRGPDHRIVGDRHAPAPG